MDDCFPFRKSLKVNMPLESHRIPIGACPYASLHMACLNSGFVQCEFGKPQYGMKTALFPCYEAASEHLERAGQNPDACPTILRHRIFHWILRYIDTLEGALCVFFWCLGVLVCTFVPNYFLSVRPNGSITAFCCDLFCGNQGCPLESDLRPLECLRKQFTQNIHLAGYQR